MKKKTSTQPLISVIIPVYNVADYLHRSLESVCQQDYPHLDIICVDDGSSDASPAILDEFAWRDPRIRVVHQSNAGAASARNAALDMARGEWVSYVDPDDYLLPHAYKTLMKHAKPGVDAIFFGTKVEAPDEMQHKVKDYQTYVSLPWSGLGKLDAQYIPGANNYLWNKLYRRSIIEQHHVRFDTRLRMAQDLCWHLRFCAYAQTVYMLPEPFYVYSLRASSTVFGLRNGPNRTSYFLQIFDNVISTYRKENLIQTLAPRILWFLSKIDQDVRKRSIPYATLLEHYDSFLQLVRKHGLHENADMLPVIHSMEEQHRIVLRARALLQRACQPAVLEQPVEKADTTHVAIVTNEAQAGLAVVLAQSVKEQQGAGCPLCLHFICDGITPVTRERMLLLQEENVQVYVHECDSTLLHALPMVRRGSYLCYLKMALPQILPHTGRVWVMDARLLLTGALPNINELEMEDASVAVSQEWDMPESHQGNIIAGIEMKHYVTSAIMAMDLDRIREQGEADNWLAVCLLNPNGAIHTELNSFNIAFQGKMAFLPDTRNWLTKAVVPSAMLGAYHQRSPWADFPINTMRLTEEWVLRQEQLTPSAMEVLLAQYTTLLRRYHWYKLLCLLTWGKRRKRLKEKRNACRSLLRQIRSLSRPALEQYGLK